MDVVRCLQFMPESGTLVSASEDCTIKLWDLEGQLAPTENQAPSAINDMEPYMTLRGHTGPILSTGAVEGAPMAEDSLLDSMLFSGGVNGAIHLWRVPQRQEVEPYGSVIDN